MEPIERSSISSHQTFVLQIKKSKVKRLYDNVKEVLGNLIETTSIPSLSLQSHLAIVSSSLESFPNPHEIFSSDVILHNIFKQMLPETKNVFTFERSSLNAIFCVCKNWEQIAKFTELNWINEKEINLDVLTFQNIEAAIAYAIKIDLFGN